jgi:Immune inhibitor A peptidase M6
MNVIVVDSFDWANRTGEEGDFLYEGVIAHELEHLLMEYSDTTETSWVDEGLADMAIFLNGYPAGGSHVAYHQVFHRETSLIRWGGGLENYGASLTYFLYLWERAGGEGNGDYTPDLEYDGPGDALIKLIFANQDDSLAGVDAAIQQFNALPYADLPSATQLFQDWTLAVYLDDESTIYGFHTLDLGSETDSWGYTIDLANDLFWDGRGIYKGAMPEPRWRKDNVPAQVALPFGTSYEVFRNPGSTFAVNFSGAPGVDIVPLFGDSHWWGGYSNNSDTILDVGYAGGTALTFDSWYFIEEGWDYGFVEALVNGEWVTVPVFDAATGAEITTDENPHENNDEGNGITGTSGGEYFVDEPEYVRLRATLPAGTTDVRFRYSTDAAYLDAGWFVSNVRIGGSPVPVTSTDWTLISGPEQDNNWLVQVVASCDLTPGRVSTGETVSGTWHVYRLTGDEFRVAGFDTSCLKGRDKGRLTVTVSNMPTGQLTVFDAPYVLRVENTGSGSKAG